MYTQFLFRTNCEVISAQLADSSETLFHATRIQSVGDLPDTHLFTVSTFNIYLFQPTNGQMVQDVLRWFSPPHPPPSPPYSLI